LAFSPDGWQLSAAYFDGSVMVWDATPLTAEVQAEREATGLLEFFASKGFVKQEVGDHIRAFKGVTEEVRAKALARDYHPDPNALNTLSWRVVLRPDAKLIEYDLALRQAQVACDLAPENGLYLNTLGVAQYRVGKFREALETLTRSEKLNAGENGPHPADIAFIAMTLHQLGNNEQLKPALGRLRQAVKARGDLPDDLALLHEAYALIEGKAGKQNP
jgi:tetratricopeptide (TPR) repeat protein